ncbi:hypothetical protein CPB85DRAFT_1439366 [Mucidula mucida]|nr:hypothetical protein CPB85DRAFT_1439366 [Mucidula mucida]
MSTRAALSVSLVGGILTTVYLLRPIRVVRVQGAYSSLYWTIRSWLWNYPVTKDYAIWDTGDPNDEQVFESDRLRLLRIWRFLRPFFVSCGYHPYVLKDPTDLFSHIIPSTPASTEKMAFPFAQCFYKADDDAETTFFSPFVWPARDTLGRDVILKSISGPQPSKELRAFRLLQSDALRNDPRNHTIPVLDYVNFNSQVFVVMPRWNVAIKADFAKVGELVRYGQAFMEAVAFLHEHNISHGDILLQNMMTDALIPEAKKLTEPRIAGVRGPKRRYALIDFETAIVDYSPELLAGFKKDVRDLASALQFNLRCIEDVIPDIVPLFESMKDSASPTQPSAAAALSRYEEICSSLSTEDLELHVEGRYWLDGEISLRLAPCVFVSDGDT